MTSGVPRIDGLTAPIAADSPIEVHYLVLPADTKIRLYGGIGFQSSDQKAPLRAPVQRRTRADLMARMRKVREEFPPPERTPGAEAELARSVEEWAPLRQAANTAMLRDAE